MSTRRSLLRRLRAHPVAAVLTGAALAVIVTLVYLNLTAGESGAVEREVERLYGIDDPQFARVVGQLLGPPLVAGNRVENLENGEEIFPAMLGAIAAAQKTVTFETFVYWQGEVAERFADALAERARAGVAVHVLLDWVGNEADTELLDRMREAGAEVETYQPLAWYELDRINNRTHRKILVVDGRLGFTGGVGIADEWLGDAQDPEHWRDSHFRVVGPVVAQMQAAFVDNWLEATGTVLHGPAYFPPLEPVAGSTAARGGPADAGDADRSVDPAEPEAAEDTSPGVTAQMFKSSPEQGSEGARLMVLLALTAASESIWIGNAYFVPDDMITGKLVNAAERGVDVRILVPGTFIDSAVTRRASRSRWGPLLEAGVEIREYRPTMYHSKIMVVDGRWVSVGSMNFDSRSFKLNDEANLNVLDRAFAAEMREVLESDFAHGHRVTLEEWENRPWREKVVETMAGWLRSQL